MRAGGLLKKAQTLRTSWGRLHIVRPQESLARQEEEISPEEREKILAQIEEAVASSRMKVTPEAFRFSPRRRGAVLPLVVNAGALVILVAGVSVAFLFSRRSEQAIVRPVAILSAEGKLVETLREQSRLELQGKDKEIASIREKLAGMDQERARLRQESDATLRKREEELQQSLARSLAEQREKLAASGLSEEAVARRVAELEAKRRAEMDSRLAALRAQSDAERAEKERTIEALRSEYQQSLATAQAERVRSQEQADRLAAQQTSAASAAKQAAADTEATAALAEMKKLQQQQGREQLVLDQFLTYYQKARDQIQADQPEAARKVLADFRRYLDEPDLAALPGIVRRRPVELFLIDSLDRLIRSQAAEAQSARNLPALIDSANLIAAVSALVQQGDASFQEQGYAKARELYLSALAEIPATRAGYARLGEIEKIFADQKKKDVAALMAAGNASYRRGNYDGAVQSYGRALEMLQLERGVVDTLLSQLADIGALRKATQDADRAGPDADPAARAQTAALLARMKARLMAAKSSADRPASDRETVVALLETKILLQKVLLSPEVTKQYPDLYDGLDRYLDALAAESKTDARLETLRDVDALLASVTRNAGPGATDALLQRYASADAKDVLVSILDKLQALAKGPVLKGSTAGP